MAYRRLVAEALAALDEEASGRVVELGSRGSAPPAEPRGWRCADVGGWIRKHRAHLPESDAWDWYERVRRAINKLACDGAVHMYAVDRFRLVVPVADVTYALRVRCEDGETIPLIVPRSCDDRRLRALISRAIRCSRGHGSFHAGACRSTRQAESRRISSCSLANVSGSSS